MPDLLLELFSEEIPARMQARAADDLKRLVTEGLVEAGLTYASAGSFATPRRLVLTLEGADRPFPHHTRGTPRAAHRCARGRDRGVLARRRRQPRPA